MVNLGGWFMTVTFVLLHHSGMPCGLCSECKLCLVVLTIRRPTAKQNVRTVPSNKLYVILFVRLLMIVWRLFHSWSCVLKCSGRLDWSVAHYLYIWLVAAYASGPLGQVAPQPSGTDHCRNMALIV